MFPERKKRKEAANKAALAEKEKQAALAAEKAKGNVWPFYLIIVSSFGAGFYRNMQVFFVSMNVDFVKLTICRRFFLCLLQAEEQIIGHKTCEGGGWTAHRW